MQTEKTDSANMQIVEDPVIGPGLTMTTVSDKIADIPLSRTTPTVWLLGALFAFGIVQVLLATIAYLLRQGVGIWGVNIPVGWGFDIINFVWWIGIGHAGTLISAILLLLKQSWRNSINRFAESMTLFAVMAAGLYPAFHTGRPWLDYWLFPLPNSMQMWPNPRSPLTWDVFAVSTYATVSALFWYLGLVPDFATLRDKAKNRFAKVTYGMAALGWRGSARHWNHYELASIILAGLSTPLVVSVHTIVSFDFATGIVPGWHATIFPPYFVAGAIFSGFAMVLTLCIPVRAYYKLEDLITTRHLDNMAKITLATGLIVAYGYSMELFAAFYSGSEYESFMMVNRMTGPYWWSYWSLILCNVVIPQLLWIRSVRRTPAILWVISIVVNIGMWLERFVIIATSLHRDFLPSSWGMYWPTLFDWSMFIGSMGLFTFMMFLFIRFLPAINMFEMRMLTPVTRKVQK